MKAVRVHAYGGPDVLTYEAVDIGRPGPGQVLVRHRAVGVNFTDVYLRGGAFTAPSLPFIPGKEAAGDVVAVGAGVTEFALGDRVAYTETPGAYAEYAVVPTHFLVHVPADITYEVAAASLLKGLTAQVLLRRAFRVDAGQTLLVHAAAGGVGTILTQWAKHLGATVIGTVGSPEKVETARRNGCDHVIDYGADDFVERVREITHGQQCHVVYDGVGRATFPASLDCLRPFGSFVSYGFASGKIPPFDIMMLVEKGSLYATWPGLTQYLARREDVVSMSRELFDVIASGAVRIDPPHVLSLADAADAHRRLESRTSTGSMVLLP